MNFIFFGFLLNVNKGVNLLLHDGLFASSTCSGLWLRLLVALLVSSLRRFLILCWLFRWRCFLCWLLNLSGTWSLDSGCLCRLEDLDDLLLVDQEGADDTVAETFVAQHTTECT